MNFSVVSINFVKTAETEALAQNILGLDEDSSSFTIQSVVSYKYILYQSIAQSHYDLYFCIHRLH